MRQILPRKNWQQSWRTLGRGASVPGRGRVVEAKSAYRRRGGGAVARAQRARSGGGGHARLFSSSANSARLRFTLISKDCGLPAGLRWAHLHGTRRGDAPTRIFPVANDGWPLGERGPEREAGQYGAGVVGGRAAS